MSSEALERAKANAAIVARGILNVKGSGDEAAAALAALLAEVAGLEQERDEARKERDARRERKVVVEELGTALAVAREREQRAVEALQELYDATTARLNDDPDSAKKQWHARDFARAALADEPAADPPGPSYYAAAEYGGPRTTASAFPAAATLAEPGDVAEAPHAHTAVASRGAAPSPGSASAAADEPRQHIDHCVFHPDHEGPCEDDGEWIAAADEPGETP